jgi:hypothetical protein
MDDATRPLPAATAAQEGLCSIPTYAQRDVEQALAEERSHSTEEDPPAAGRPRH